MDEELDILRVGDLERMVNILARRLVVVEVGEVAYRTQMHERGFLTRMAAEEKNEVNRI